MKLQTVAMIAMMIGGGCALDEGEGGDELTTSEATSSISMAGGVTWRGTTALPLGPLSQQTCFLSGMGGAFVGNPALYGQPGSFKPAEVAVRPNFGSGLWEVITKSGVGAGVQANVVCVNVPYTSSAIHEFSWSDNLSSNGYIGTANTHCFLRDVWATSGLSTWNTNLRPTIAIERTALANGKVEFDMNDSFVNNFGGDQDYGGATAVCIDYPATGQWGYTFNGATSTLLRDSYPNGAPVATANTLCALTGVSGGWVGAGYTTGAILDNQSTNWSITVAAGRTGQVACVR